MKIGIGLLLVTLGAILRFAVEDNWDSIDVETVGLILILVGLAAFITGVALEFTARSRSAPMPSAPYPPYPQPPYPPQPPPPASPPKA